MNGAFHLADPRPQVVQLAGEHEQALARERWDAMLGRVGNPGKKVVDLGQALGGNDAELRALRPQHVGQHGALAHKQVAGTMKRQHPLLLNRFHGHKAHGGACHRFRDRLSVSGVVLAALHIWLDVDGRHQPYIVTKRDQLASLSGHSTS